MSEFRKVIEVEIARLDAKILRLEAEVDRIDGEARSLEGLETGPIRLLICDLQALRAILQQASFAYAKLGSLE